MFLLLAVVELSVCDYQSLAALLAGLVAVVDSSCSCTEDDEKQGLWYD